MDRNYLWFDRQSYSKLISADGKGLYWASDLKAELPIIMKEGLESSTSPINLHDLFLEAMRTHGNRLAVRYKVQGKWINWTYSEYYKDSKSFAAALVNLGLTDFSTTNIIGFNAPQWLIGYVGSVFAGAIPVGVYSTNNAEACEYIASHSEAQMVLVQNEAQLAKYLKIWPKLPQIKAIVVYWPGKDFESLRVPNVYAWDEFLKLGQAKDYEVVEQRILQLRPTRCITLIYTSGTTGPPKGVLLSHDNLIWTAKTIVDSSGLLTDDERLVSYLPLSHIAAQLMDIIASIYGKAALTCADEDALQGSLGITLKETKPTTFFGVPRVFEKMEEKIRAVGASRTGVQKKIADWAKRVGFEASMNQLNNRPTGFGYAVANRLIYNRIREALGFEHCKHITVGAAPISKSCLDYFLSLNIFINNAYGMSECSAPATINSHRARSIYSAGCSMPGTELVIKGPDFRAVPNGTQGEICFKGRNKFMGYFKNESATKETIDHEGFIHSGDKGYIDDQGFLFITGRFKDLIITAGGENIPPVLIEDLIKEKCGIISYAFLIGDAKKYLTALVTLKTTAKPDGETCNQLAPEVISALQKEGIEVKTVEEAAGNKEVNKYIQKCIEEANKQATSRAQEVKKFRILLKDFSIGGGELTPTLKVKRKVVADMYHAVIEDLYAEPKL